MEFSQKLQELRKMKGLTQEEMAELLYVSSTAVSKWESGRGCPNIDSLKAIAKLYSVTVDDLLSGEQLLSLAEEDRKRNENQVRDLFFGLLDISNLVLLFLPLFAQRGNELVSSVALFSLSLISPWLKFAFCDFVISTGVFGILTLALQNCEGMFWVKYKHRISIILSAASVLLFVISLQPYPAIFIFLLLVVKMFVLLKRN